MKYGFKLRISAYMASYSWPWIYMAKSGEKNIIFLSFFNKLFFQNVFEYFSGSEFYFKLSIFRYYFINRLFNSSTYCELNMANGYVLSTLVHLKYHIRLLIDGTTVQYTTLIIFFLWDCTVWKVRKNVETILLE